MHLAPHSKGVTPLYVILQRHEEVRTVLYPRHMPTPHDRLAFHLVGVRVRARVRVSVKVRVRARVRVRVKVRVKLGVGSAGLRPVFRSAPRGGPAPASSVRVGVRVRG